MTKEELKIFLEETRKKDGITLRTERIDFGIKLNRLSEVSGLTEKHILDIEFGRTNYTIGNLTKYNLGMTELVKTSRIW